VKCCKTIRGVKDIHRGFRKDEKSSSSDDDDDSSNDDYEADSSCCSGSDDYEVRADFTREDPISLRSKIFTQHVIHDGEWQRIRNFDGDTGNNCYKKFNFQRATYVNKNLIVSPKDYQFNVMTYNTPVSKNMFPPSVESRFEWINRKNGDHTINVPGNNYESFIKDYLPVRCIVQKCASARKIQLKAHDSSFSHLLTRSTVPYV